MSNARFAVIAILLLLGLAWMIFSHIRRCLCDWCESPYAIWLRGDEQFCRGCKNAFDKHQKPINRRRGLLKRIRRSAA